ncbi:MAG TPA: hypothetical protein VE988_11905, partial [Gemmataceae bacterium]|nr:hypothetical protein [Gemmataceae bacterium]
MTTAAAPKKLFLIDAHGLLFQVFHAIPEMSSPGGMPTNAVFGFTRDMLFIRKELQPDYLVCVFDPPGGTFRDRIFPEYKAQRGPMPDSMRPQIRMAYQLLEAMRIPALTVEDFEADDVLAT